MSGISDLRQEQYAEYDYLLTELVNRGDRNPKGGFGHLSRSKISISDWIGNLFPSFGEDNVEDTYKEIFGEPAPDALTDDERRTLLKLMKDNDLLSVKSVDALWDYGVAFREPTTPLLQQINSLKESPVVRATAGLITADYVLKGIKTKKWKLVADQLLDQFGLLPPINCSNALFILPTQYTTILPYAMALGLFTETCNLNFNSYKDISKSLLSSFKSFFKEGSSPSFITYVASQSLKYYFCLELKVKLYFTVSTGFDLDITTSIYELESGLTLTEWIAQQKKDFETKYPTSKVAFDTARYLTGGYYNTYIKGKEQTEFDLANINLSFISFYGNGTVPNLLTDALNSSKAADASKVTSVFKKVKKLF